MSAVFVLWLALVGGGSVVPWPSRIETPREAAKRQRAEQWLAENHSLFREDAA